MVDTKLIAKNRDLQGSSNSRRLRKAGNLPCVVYGEGKEAIPVQIEMHAFEQLLHHHATETLITKVALEGAGDVQVLVKDVQRHPVTGDVMHVDLLKIVAGQTIQVDILLELVGEAVGVKGGGVMEHVMHSIAIECLPKDLVESIEVDVSEMEVGDTLCVSDLNLGSKFKTVIEDEAIVAAVAEQRAEEEPEEEAAEEEAEGAEPEVISEKKADDEDAG
jgi:large subunit ribosomal protein L25